MEEIVKGPQKLLVLVVFALVAIGSSATDIYIAQTAAGAGNGADCADAYAASWFNNAANWGTKAGQIAPGTTVHLCGTITSPLTGQGSGSSGNAIDLFFETGAKLSEPFCPASGCINLSGLSYITVDGGIPCGPSVTNKATCNGIIESNANGSGLANQNASAIGIYLNNVSNIEIKNLLVQNMYVRTSNTDLAPSSPLPSCIYLPGTASQVSIHDSTLHDALWCVDFISGSAQTELSVYNTEIYNVGHGIALGVEAQTDDTAYFYSNYIHDTSNWDSSNCAYHNDGIHDYQVSGGAITNLYMYNNTFGGNWGVCNTAFIYTEGLGFTQWQFNNLGLAQNTATLNNGCFNGTVGSTGSTSMYNNTCIAAVTQGNYDIKWEGAVDIQNNATANTTQILTVMPTDVTVPAGKLIDYNFWGESATSCKWFASGSSSKSCNGGAGYSNFSQWQTYLRAAFPASGGDTHGVASTAVNLGLNSSGVPQTGSPLIAAGANLYSLCNGQPNPGLGALCSDAAGNTRPSSGNWDAGALNSSTGGPNPAPPSGLAATVVP
jgi:hypothetical protein